jgi:hypothetical protein
MSVSLAIQYFTSSFQIIAASALLDPRFTRIPRSVDGAVIEPLFNVISFSTPTEPSLLITNLFVFSQIVPLYLIV